MAKPNYKDFHVGYLNIRHPESGRMIVGFAIQKNVDGELKPLRESSGKFKVFNTMEETEKMLNTLIKEEYGKDEPNVSLKSIQDGERQKIVVEKSMSGSGISKDDWKRLQDKYFQKDGNLLKFSTENIQNWGREMEPIMVPTLQGDDKIVAEEFFKVIQRDDTTNNEKGGAFQELWQFVEGWKEVDPGDHLKNFKPPAGRGKSKKGQIASLKGFEKHLKKQQKRSQKPERYEPRIQGVVAKRKLLGGAMPNVPQMINENTVNQYLDALGAVSPGVSAMMNARLLQADAIFEANMDDLGNLLGALLQPYPDLFLGQVAANWDDPAVQNLSPDVILAAMNAANAALAPFENMPAELPQLPQVPGQPGMVYLDVSDGSQGSLGSVGAPGPLPLPPAFDFIGQMAPPMPAAMLNQGFIPMFNQEAFNQSERAKVIDKSEKTLSELLIDYTNKREHFFRVTQAFRPEPQVIQRALELYMRASDKYYTARGQ